MALDLEDTIVAVASAPGGSVRGIVRLTGPQCTAIVAACFLPTKPVEWSAVRQPTAIAGDIRLAGEERLPAELLLWPDRRSYTRQPSAELHTFGSPPLLDAALAAVTQAGARLAGPGEFTLRAFLAGRIDLTQAEAVLGVIDARDAAQLKTALGQLAGGLAQPLHALRDELLDLLAHLEAGLDFVDEDIEFISSAALERSLAQAAERTAAIAEQMKSRGEIGGVARVVLWGRPNAGKSSLLNALIGEDAALVSPLAGTTRDYVARRITIGERTVEFFDTAGVDGEEASGDSAERMIGAAAGRMTAAAKERGDLRLWCLDASQPVPPEPTAADDGVPTLIVWTKTDLPRMAADRSGVLPQVHTSAATGEGLADLRQAIVRSLDADAAGECVAGTAIRCRDSIRLAADSLARARQLVADGGGEELVAAELHTALDELGRVVGAVYTDDILDRIFSRFCIGK